MRSNIIRTLVSRYKETKFSRPLIRTVIPIELSISFVIFLKMEGHGALKEIAKFDWSDYTMFGIMLSVSALIGVYFGCFGNKQNDMEEYFQGRKQMKVLPVAVSLIASCVSGITLIGVPTEVYSETSTYILIVPSLFLTCLFIGTFILPIFYELQVFSAYEYLEKRFNKAARTFASILYCISTLLVLPLYIYVPSLCLSQVIDISVHIVSLTISVVCVFYTVIGGLKAVVWADFFQTLVSLAACIAIVIIGTLDIGGISFVLDTAQKGGKFDIFNMDPNPFQRTTFWTITIGSFFSWSCYMGVAQACVQRFMSLPSAKAGYYTLVTFGIGLAIMAFISVYAGLLIYTSYYGCDPIEKKFISQADQIFTYFVLDKIGYVPALPGLFIAGIFSAGLSSLSTGYNTIAGIIYDDYLKNKVVNEKYSNIIVKLLIIGISIFSVVMVFAVERMGKVLTVAYMLSSITFCPILILFVLGMMIPFANTKGSLIGAITGSVFLLWISIGSTFSKVHLKPIKIYPIDTCPSNHTELLQFNSTIITNENNEDDTFVLYKLSYMLYIAAGTIIGVIIGIIISYFTEPDMKNIDPSLISPPIRRFLPKRSILENESVKEKLMTDANQR